MSLRALCFVCHLRDIKHFLLMFEQVIQVDDVASHLLKIMSPSRGFRKVASPA